MRAAWVTLQSARASAAIRNWRSMPSRLSAWPASGAAASAGGLQAWLGETGWQLSHGERSGIFLARALLQRAPLTILDESFAALDPATLSACLACVLRRAPTLIVIAHP